MRSNTYRPLSMSLLAALTFTFPARAQSQAQSQPPSTSAQQPASQQNPDAAADAAKKSKDGKTSPAPKKVFTNEDLSSMGAGGISVVGSAKSTAKTGQTATGEPKNEQYWRNRAQRLRNEMAEVDRQIAQIEAANQSQHSASANSNGTNPPPPPPSAYTVGAHVRANGNNQLERLKNRKAQIQREVDQLEEEARRANVPPGWLR